MKVRYHEAAEDEMLQEIGYLERRERGLGRRFFDDVKRAETLLAEHSEAGQEIRPGIRKCLLRTFRIAAGEEILIAKAGKAIARLVPVGGQRPERALGIDKGRVVINDDFDAPLPDDVLAGFER